MKQHYKKLYLTLISVNFAMTVISSLTILAGLIPVLWLSFGNKIPSWQFITVCVAAFFIFAYFIDNKVSPLSAFATRNIYNHHFSRGAIWVFAVSLILCAAFLIYSFSMSKDSANVAGIQNLDGKALYKAKGDVSDEFRVKEDSIKSSFDKETSEMIALIDASIQDKEKQKSDLNRMYGLSRGKRDALRFELSEQINVLSAEKLALKKERDSSYIALITVLKSEWGKDEITATKTDQAAEFSSLVDKYARRFAFLSGWSIIIVLISASAGETILLVSNETHESMISGTLFEIPYSIGMVFAHNTINWNRSIIKAITTKERPPLSFPFSDTEVNAGKKGGLSFGKKK